MSRRGLSSYFRPPEGYRRTAAVQVFQRSQVARPDPDLGPTRLPSRERTALSSLAVASLRRSVAVSRYVKLGRATPSMSTNLSPELSTFGGQLLRRTVRIYSRSPLSRQPRQNIIYTVAPRLRTLPGNPRCGGGRGPGRDLNSELPGSGFWGSKRGLPGGVPGGARGAPGGPPPGARKPGKYPPKTGGCPTQALTSVPTGRVIKYPRKCTPPPGAPGNGPPRDPPKRGSQKGVFPDPVPGPWGWSGISSHPERI